jgi:predicted ATPase/signal transduction histidine kinase/CheY-like chemotaxis protein
VKEFDCSVVATVSDRGGVALHRAVGRDGTRVLLKVLDPSRCSQRTIDELGDELEIASSLDTLAVVRPLELGTHRGFPALLLESFDGEPCRRAQATAMRTEPFLALAIGMARALGEVHAADIVHKNIEPHNILIHPATGEVRLTGFGVAARLARGPEAHPPSPLLEGSLAYLSPEQTGRMRANIDGRADLYSLGIVLFELATGQLPFQARDAVEWVHCHVARPPPSPTEINPDVPDAVANVIRRLLAKRPEDRYQSARGLVHDLERCHRAWSADGAIAYFRLGERDISDRLHFSQQLVGREAERDLLAAALTRVCSSGALELVLVFGPSGVGKSSLANQLERSGVRFLRGKFDEVSRAIPYSTVVHALSELVLGILAAGETELARWRVAIGEALGGLGKLMADVIPPLRLVIGEPPEVPALPLAEAEQRFRRVFRAFVRVFTSKACPLVLFLDDLQWADAGSLRLIEDLATSDETHHLLLALAYRDAEVDPTGPLPALLARLRAAAPTTELGLQPLDANRVAEIVAGAVRREPSSVGPLAELVYEKAGGSPFFVIEFLTTLYRERLLYVDDATSTWSYDLERIGEQRYTENVVELMVRRFGTLSARARDALAIAACIGSRFSVPLLAAAAETPEDAMRADLADPLRDGLVVRTRDGLAFGHDRFRDAAAALSSQEQQRAIHLRLGHLLMARTPPEAQDPHIFEIVTHLDLGAADITPREQRVSAAALALRAVRKARLAAAYAAAAAYASVGLRLAGDDGWLDARELCFALGLEHVQCSLSAGLLADTDRLLPSLLRHARTRLERALVLGVEIDSHNIKGEGSQAIDCALACLGEFGIEMAAHPSNEDVEHALASLWQLLGESTIEQLIFLPPMTDTEIEAALDILARLYIPAYYSDNNLLCLHLCEAVRLSLQHGNAPSSSHAYGWFGVILISLLQRPHEGYRFAKLGFDLVQHRQYAAYRAKAHLQMKIACYWTRSMDESVAHSRAAFETARESGDVAIECFACSEAVLSMVARGDRLADVEREIASGLGSVRRAGFGDVAELLVGLEQLVRALRGKTRDITTFDDEHFSEAEFEARLAWDRMPTLVFYYLVVKLMARFLAADDDAAFAAGERARPFLWASTFGAQNHWFHVFHALSLAAVWERLSEGERDEALSTLAGHERRLHEWALANPATFECDEQLVCAEIARVRGQPQAARLYDEAIRSAQGRGFVQRSALANELASRYHRRSGSDFIADAYLREARALYARWGAEGKVRQIDRLRPALFAEHASEPGSSVAVSSSQLDLLAIVRGSQAISSELVTERIASALLEAVLEHGGAERGWLFVARGGELRLEAGAVASAQGVHAQALPEPPRDLSSLFPAALVQFAQRTRQPVLLNDAAADPGVFAGDPHILQHRLRSVLAFPILRHSQLVALLYLENRLVPGAFSPERLTALGVVAAQAAISLENASLLAKERAAVAAAEEARGHSSLLAEATALLIEPLSQGEALARLAGLCVRDLADRCAIDWLDGAEQRRLCEAHAEPRREPGTESILSAPLVARGQALGKLTLGFVTRRHSMAHMDLCWQLADRAAMALDNARLRLEERSLRERLERADRLASLGTLAAGIAHEISNPTAYVAANLSFLRDELHDRNAAIGDVEINRAIEDALAGTVRIRHIVSGLKQFARPSGHDRSLVDVRAEIGAALDMTRHEIVKRARLVVELPPLLPSVVASPTELGQVFVNLLVNAAQAIPEGRRAENEVHVAARAGGGQVVIDVRDTGAGIPADIKHRIFDPFFTTKPVGVGTGLGLAICHGIVSGIGGAIEVDSDAGVGTLFRVRLPVAQVAAPTPLPSELIVTRPERRARILVIDDDALVARGHARLLSAAHDVEIANSSKDALARLSAGERYDVVLCDLVMPDMDGQELEARVADAVPDMVGRLIFVTGASSPAARAFLEAGRAHLDKPIDPALLRALIAERLTS